MADFYAMHVIEALRSGVPSRAVGAYFSEARPGMMKKIEGRMEAVRAGGPSDGMIFTGHYGEGKTHLLNTVFSVATQNNMAVSYVALGKETPMSNLPVLYQKIIANKEAILNDAADRAQTMKAEAEQQAKALLEQAAIEHNQMISEHEIMLRAHARADEFVNMAVNKAQGIIDNATIEANSLKDAANQYMNDVLEHLSKIISYASQSATNNYSRTAQSTQDSYEKLITSLNEYQGIIQDNIVQLHAAEAAPAQEVTEAPVDEQPVQE
jgi:hypothetical protein